MTGPRVRLPARELTLDDVADLAVRDPEHRYELQEGNLRVMPPADDEQAEMTMRIGACPPLGANGANGLDRSGGSAARH
jgi:hypothetical protein